MTKSIIILPLLSYGLLALLFAARSTKHKFCEGIAKAHLTIFSVVAVSTELLSYFQALTVTGIAAVWVFCFGSLAVFTALLVNRSDVKLPRINLRHLEFLTTVTAGLAILFLLITLVTALVYPPNSWDSMTYHMPRVMHWVDQASVSFYPTSITRQNYQMPLAEFAILHLYLLGGNDLYANLVQWLSYVAIICLTILIAAELGLTKTQRLVAAIVAMTLPMAILQSSSTQNDLVVSSFVLGFALFMLRLRRSFRAGNLVFAAISLGLALLTKGTAYLYCFGLGIFLSIPVLAYARADTVQAVKRSMLLFAVLVSALMLNVGHLYRNYDLYGHPLSGEGGGYINEELSLGTLRSNMIRNAALHLGSPLTGANAFVEQTVESILGTQLNNPKTTFLSNAFFVPYSMHEDYAGNFIHMLILLPSLIFFPVAWFRSRYRSTVWFGLALFFSALVYCMVLKWQPWGSRLQTPLFALASPMLAVLITIGSHKIFKVLSLFLIFTLIMYGLQVSISNNSRSLRSLNWLHKDRVELYFHNRTDLMRQTEAAIKKIDLEGLTVIGLFLGEDDWEYPFWVIANKTQHASPRVSFEHIGVNNESSDLGTDSTLPPFVIASKNLNQWKMSGKYQPILISEQLSVFEKLSKVISDTN